MDNIILLLLTNAEQVVKDVEAAVAELASKDGGAAKLKACGKVLEDILAILAKV